MLRLHNLQYARFCSQKNWIYLLCVQDFKVDDKFSDHHFSTNRYVKLLYIPEACADA